MRISTTFTTTLAVLAVIPSAAMAQTTADDYKSLVIGPAKLGSYSVTVEAREGSRTVNVSLKRRSGSSRQSHVYVVRANPSLSGTTDDQTAVLVADAGKRASGVLEFEARTPSFTDRERCVRGGSVRAGRVKGSLTLNLGDDRFGKLRIRRAKATYGFHADGSQCVGAVRRIGSYLSAAKRRGPTRFFLDAWQEGSRASIVYEMVRPGQIHTIQVVRRTRALGLSSGLNRARLASIGPFLRGTARVSGGRLRGDFRGVFDFVGTRGIKSTRDVTIGRTR